ncbi:MAG TPA: HlyD family efflux transporter periplasmic adaptor subunit [Gammaproteobacteria bacterium]|nr:HlyD family efflux transporter periplasmic adaptor subunit [Gammaproteobacteria bacterium]
MIERDKIRSKRLRVMWSFALLIGLLVGSYWYFFLRPVVESDDAYVETNIVPVVALTPGVVTKIGVDDSVFVHANQWLLSQEQQLTSANLANASASLAGAVRQTKSRFALVTQKTAEIAVLRAQQTKLMDDLSRYLQAKAVGGVASQKVSDTRADIAITDSQIVAAQAALDKAQALVTGTTVYDNPFVKTAEANFIKTYIQNRRSIVLSPVDGYVAHRRVQVGEQVKPGQWLMAIVPLNDLWITANIKETRLAHVRTGEPVQIQAQTYGEDVTFHGRVIGVVPAGGTAFSLFPPDNTTGNYIHIVERVPVRISLDPKEVHRHPLRPGMSVSVTIDTQEYRHFKKLVSDVKVANASFETNIFNGEMQAAKRAAKQIIEKNVHPPRANLTGSAYCGQVDAMAC